MCIRDKLHSDNIQQLYDVARYVEDEARLYQRFEKLTVGFGRNRMLPVY